MPQVSVVVPVYNVEKYLPHCIESLRNQTINDIEIILVDDESPDNCPKICDQYAENDSRIKVIHKKNAGLGMACNSGLEIASGEYIAFCDSDDWIAPNMYESMLQWAKENNVDVVFTGYRKVNDAGECRSLSVSNKKISLNNKFELSSFLLDLIASTPEEKKYHLVPMSAKTTLYRRSLIQENAIHFNSERVFICEDLIWNCDILTYAKKALVMPIAFYNYRDNPSSLSCTVRKDRFPHFVKLRNELIKRYANVCDITQLETRANRFLISESIHYIRVLANSTLPYCEVLPIIKKICHHSIWQNIKNQYPSDCMAKSRRIIYELIIHRHAHILYAICKIVGNR